MNTDQEVIQRFVDEENRRFSAGHSDSKIFRKHSAWVTEIAKKAIPEDVPEETKNDFYFHCLRKGLLPTANKKSFVLLQNSYKRLLPHIHDEHTKLFKYRGIFLFGKNADLNEAHYNKAKKIIVGARRFVYADSFYSATNLEKLSAYSNDHEMLATVIDVLNEMIYQPEQRAWIPFDENMSIRIIALLSHTPISLDIQNKLLDENSDRIYDRNERINRYVAKIPLAKKNLLNYLET